MIILYNTINTQTHHKTDVRSIYFLNVLSNIVKLFLAKTKCNKKGHFSEKSTLRKCLQYNNGRSRKLLARGVTKDQG